MRTILTALAILPLMANAQWGIRGTILHYDRFIPKYHMNLLFGLDCDVSDRTSLGLEHSFTIGLFNGEDATSNYTYYDDYSVSYIYDARSSVTQLRSSYFLTDNGNAGAYVATTIGIRMVELEVDPYEVYDSYGRSDPSWAVRETATATLIPIGVRLGFRSGLEGFYQDIYAGVGLTLGDRELVSAPYAEEDLTMKSLFIQLGYAWGIGW